MSCRSVQEDSSGDLLGGGARSRYVARVALPSKTEINRCGNLLRSYLDSADGSGDSYEWDEVQRALDVLGEFRASFQYPLTKVTIGLRQMVARESQTVVVAQRLKRMDRILGKLQRMPKTRLARMEDIGGCRAVLASPDEVAGVLRRIHRRWQIVRERDYVSAPKPSGYRAVHLVVTRDDCRIEVQLRTQGQQEWADAVEKFASRFDLPLKDEQGPDEVLEFFRLASEGIYGDEYGSDITEDFMASFREAQEAMLRWTAEHGR